MVQSFYSQGFVPGLVPEPIDLTPTDGLQVFAAAAEVAASPTSYDLRPLNKLTAVRNQGSCGSCWDFAATGSLESCLMPAEAWDFSENNLKNLAGFDLGCCSGGNRTMSAAYYARWGGAVSEADDPYRATSCSSPANCPVKKHVQEVIYLPNRTSSMDNENIKQAVMSFGAVYTTYYHSNSYYRSATYGYYCPSAVQANHAVCIVGWDDNYNRTNFLTAAPGNGAFLIRNSWGASWGQGGYFWMSYYDATLGRSENAVFRSGSDNYDGIYQYDTLGWISSTGYGTNTAWFANVFTAAANTKIVAASWYAPAANSTYEVYVHVNPSNGPMGTQASYESGTRTYAGYATVNLDTPVSVTAGQKFSVIVKSTTPGYGYPIPLEVPYSGFCSKATASAGQSYMSSNGTSWKDTTTYRANANVCLKAFSASSSGPGPAALSVSPIGGLSASGQAGGPFSPSSQAYTLTNTGGASLNWTASASRSWLSLSATSGTLAAGASATVAVSINSSANSLASGSYSGTVTFANATNGNGNTTRNANLTVSPQPQGSLSVSPATGLTASGVVGGPFSPSSQNYTLTNTGGAAIDWSCSKAQAWTSVSALSGVLNAGASTTVTVSINSSANTLVAGSYPDTVTFTNTTNGVGNTSRPVALSVTATPPPPPPPPTGSYRVVPTTFSWINPTSMTRLMMGNDTVGYGRAMPFAFKLYGKSYSTLYIGSNGVLGFSLAGLYIGANTSLPSTGYPNAAIYPFWDNLNPSASGAAVYVGATGYAPNRKMVVTWLNVPMYPSTATFSFQAILEEGTNDIVFQYLNVSPTNIDYGGGKSATIGIENETGTEGLLYSFNKAGAVSNNMALRFTTSTGP